MPAEGVRRPPRKSLSHCFCIGNTPVSAGREGVGARTSARSRNCESSLMTYPVITGMGEATMARANHLLFVERRKIFQIYAAAIQDHTTSILRCGRLPRRRDDFRAACAALRDRVAPQRRRGNGPRSTCECRGPRAGGRVMIRDAWERLGTALALRANIPSDNFCASAPRTRLPFKARDPRLPLIDEELYWRRALVHPDASPNQHFAHPAP